MGKIWVTSIPRLIFDRRIRIRVELSLKQKVEHHAEKATLMRDRGKFKIPKKSENSKINIIIFNVFGPKNCCLGSIWLQKVPVISQIHSHAYIWHKLSFEKIKFCENFLRWSIVMRIIDFYAFLGREFDSYYHLND